MDFQTTLSPDNEKEFIKSWTSAYQSGLLQFRGEKRESGDIGFLRPVAAYLIAFVAGYYILIWGIQGVGFSLTGLEVTFGGLVLFILAINFSYTFRPSHFRRIARRRIFPQGTSAIHVDNTGISFTHQGRETVFWEWQSVTKVIFFARTLVLYQGEFKGFADTKKGVLLLNKEDLPTEQCDALIHDYLRPLKIENKFVKYNSYSDIVIFIGMCLVVALACLPISFLL